MKFIFQALLLLAGLVGVACGGNEHGVTADYRIIPRPQTILLGEGSDFELNPDTRIVCEDEGAFACAEFLADYIREVTGFEPAIEAGVQNTADDHVIVLASDAPGKGAENYEIGVTARRISVRGGSDAGLFYAMQTLRKAMGAEGAAKVLFPAVHISDRPHLGYRGVMLDVGRTYYPVAEVKRVIDLAALHNLNVFHWHLTDDQGWRIEIDACPELTRTGAERPDTLLTGEAGVFRGFYTKQEIREIVDYAARRYIEVIPEIDMPGHMTAALASYPELGCTGGPYTITSQPGVRRDILCVGSPHAFGFVEKVLEEVIELFPSQYIHIGGDEAPRVRWEKCPRCQALIRKAGLKADASHSPEARLQGYFNTRIEQFLARRGRRLIGWDEIVDGGMSPGATVMSWRGAAGGVKAARAGFDVIMSPNSSFYFDYYQSSDVEAEPPTIGGYVPLQKVYETKVVPEELTADEARHILGVQANAWTTYMRTPQILHHMLLPRMAALAEVAWSDERSPFPVFMGRLDRHVKFYERDNFDYFPYFYDVKGTFTADYGRKAVGMTLTSLPDAAIRYTLDGSEPTDRSALYTDTVWISFPASIRAVATMPGGRRSEPFREEVAFNKATMRPIRLLTAPHPKYAASSLNDGLRGKRVFTYGNWTGYLDQDAEVVVDLGRTETVSQVAFNALLDYGSHIMDAARATVWVSDDGDHFREVSDRRFPAVPYGAVKRIFRHEADFSPALRARYVKLRVERSEHLPEAYFEQDIQPYLFLDEIYVN